MRRYVLAPLMLLVGLALASAARAETRVALVIGNGAYQTVRGLPNPPRDARAMGDLFRAAGFDSVTVKTDLGVSQMRAAFREFARAAEGADIAAVFYAGHGLEVGGHNYLVPIDARLEHDTDVEDEAIDLDHILDQLAPAKRLKLVILDACRENPFAPRMKTSGASRSVGRGLAPPASERADVLVAYAAAAGATAADGDGDHSPFTAALLDNLTRPGIDIRLALGKARDEVAKATGGRQIPFKYDSLGGDTLALAPVDPPRPPAPATPIAIETPARPVREVPAAKCGGNSDEALSAPIRNVFAALSAKNLSSYAEQWSESAIWKNGKTGETRGRDEILRRKDAQFRSWGRVDARIASLSILTRTDVDALIEDVYVMNIQGSRGPFQDRGRERYRVQCQDDGSWRITENLDYAP
jgi:hypothetical protein